MNYYLVEPLAYTGSGSGSFTYEFDGQLAAGTIVEVPLGRKFSFGVVVAEEPKPKFATKATTAIINQPPLPSHLLELAHWLAGYYASSVASVWQTLLPAGLDVKRRARVPSAEFRVPRQTHTLTSGQQKVIDAIKVGGQSHLLHGVTGSGKTRVYLELARQTLAAGQSVIVLVPEIALTPQIQAQFEAEFGPVVISTHSRLTPAQRHQAWLEALNSTEPRIAVGPRSALFMPLKNIGLIVVDECHETSYKQEQNPRYWAPTAAGKLAQLTGAKLVMGSATPGLFEQYLAKHGKLAYHQLNERINQIPAPEAKIVDLRDKSQLRHSQIFSQALLNAVKDTLAAGRQSLLFINRRGSASSLICGDCGTVQACPNCQIPLTFHADLAKLRCHYCNYSATPPAVCPNCQSANLRYLGGGTKRVEAEVKRLFPAARIARLDKDSFTPSHLQAIYKGLHDGTIDILIGTQMIAKGLDLPRIDTVGVVSADTLLHIPDFAAAERTFQLLTQVSGRAGRGDRPGQVIIQTYTPNHPAIMDAAKGDYDGFAAAELEHRKLLGYPPYQFLMKVTASAKTSAKAEAECQKLADQLKGLTVLGPAPAQPEFERGRSRWHIIIKSPKRSALVEAAHKLPRTAAVDLDPLNLL